MVLIHFKVGPKGQVVLPVDFRKKHHIVSGEEVMLDVEPVKSGDILRAIESTPKIHLGDLDPHWAYDDQMRHRDKKRHQKTR